jgi:hypothetical protein
MKKNRPIENVGKTRRTNTPEKLKRYIKEDRQQGKMSTDKKVKKKHAIKMTPGKGAQKGKYSKRPDKYKRQKI